MSPQTLKDRSIDRKLNWTKSSGRIGSNIGGDDSYGSSGRDTNDSYGSNERPGSSGYGYGITGGAGSGNKYTSGVQESSGLASDYGTGHSGETTDRNEPYSGHREHGSGATGGVGFGNKSSSHSADDTPYGGNPDIGRNSDPYTGQNEYGSGTTGGAGFGNKTSSRNDDKKNDSTSGKLMEKMGKRANADVAALIRRFENIIEYKPGDRNAAAVDAYKMKVETAALIRAAEDILSLTRVMKEMWLFGKLQTVGTDEAEERAEESAKGVEAGLRRLMGAEKS
ncbi:MAG: hypothetical protein Q9186_001651 [Xanthomendoza sp. 1 TL-2023]